MYGLDTVDLLSMNIKQSECQVFENDTESLTMLIHPGPKVNGCKGLGIASKASTTILCPSWIGSCLIVKWCWATSNCNRELSSIQSPSAGILVCGCRLSNAPLSGSSYRAAVWNTLTFSFSFGGISCRLRATSQETRVLFNTGTQLSYWHSTRIVVLNFY